MTYVLPNKKRWCPCRVDIVDLNRQHSILDVGPDAVVTVLIKGPNVDLKFEDVDSLKIEYLKLE